jgi:hypothetical protein
MESLSCMELVGLMALFSILAAIVVASAAILHGRRGGWQWPK